MRPTIACLAPSLIALAIGCASSSARPGPCPAATAALASPAIPGEDDALRRWKAIAANPDKAPPTGTTAASLVPELLAYLGSPDPVRRDHIAYDVLAAWLRGAALTDADARHLGRRLLDNLGAPLGPPDGVFLRSFSALVLAEIVRRDTHAPYLTDDERREILRATGAYAARETDLRGHTGAAGWAHAAAHTADLLARLAQLPAFDDVARATILDAVASFVVRRHGTIFAYGEDSRLAASVLAAVNAGVPAPALDAWLAAIAAPLRENLTATFDPGLFAAQRNARNLVFTLFVRLSTAPSPSAGGRALLDRLRTLLAE
jgi:hypothetical protein